MRNRLLAGAAFCTISALVPSAYAADPPTGSDYVLQADEVTYDTDKHFVTAHGHVEVDYKGRILTADTLTYDQTNDVVTADGHVVTVDDKGDVAFSNHAVMTDKMRDGALEGFQSLIGKTGRLAATTANRQQDRYTTAYRAAYTPCKICNKPGQRTPLWEIKSYRVVHDQVKKKIRFKDATIELMGVPILRGVSHFWAFWCALAATIKLPALAGNRRAFAQATWRHLLFGAVLGTLFGALIVQTFQSGISLAGVNSLYQVLAEGILVIVAVALDQWIRRVKA